MELRIKKETAKRLYPEAQDWFKEILEETFGKECFLKRNFRDIKTFEDACDELAISMAINKDSCDETAYKKLKIIVKAINQGWTPDWNDTNQRKWFPWFKVSSSGLGFDDALYSCDDSDATVGSRLCFESEEKARYAANQFIDLYKQFLI